MGHRAVVAYERDDGLFDVRYSHWGSHDLKLRNDIAEETPLGGDAEEYEPEFITAMLAELEEHIDEADDDVEVSGALVGKQDSTPVEPEVEAKGITIAEVCEYVDESNFHAEAMYVVTREFDVRAFKPLYVPFDGRGSLLVEPRWVGEDPVSNDFDRGWFKGMVSELATFVDDGVLTEAEAADRAINHALEKFADALNKMVLGHSTAVEREHRERNPTALVKMTGRTRLHSRGDVMLPSGYIDAEEWERPDDFTSLPAPSGRDRSLAGVASGDD